MRMDSIHIVSKLNDPTNSLVTQIRTLIKEWWINNPVCRIVDELDISPSTLIIAVGGDGTMLHAMRLSAVYDAACIGIHAGNVGFLTDVTVTGDVIVDRQIITNMLECISVVTSLLQTEERITLSANMGSMIACNDIVVTSPQQDRMLHYELWIDGRPAGIHKANGVVISTPTGSTAYGLSVGGAIMYPSAKVVQIAPIAAVGLTSRPIIVPSTSKILVSAKNTTTLHVAYDGTTVDVNDREVMIREHIRPAKVLHLPEWDFFRVLTAKLGWNR